MTELYIEAPYKGAMAMCDQCGELWAWDDQEVIHSVQDRLTAGAETPSGECPDDNCRALCFLVKRSYIGQPTRHTAPYSESVLEVVGWSRDELESHSSFLPSQSVTAVLTYRQMFFILEREDGNFWTILERTEVVGTLAECEIQLNEFVDRSGYPPVTRDY